MKDVDNLICGKNISNNQYLACGAQARYFYLHDKDICCYCEKHNYQCGKALTLEEAKLRNVNAIEISSS